MVKEVIFIAGLPGSGKTTKAQLIASSRVGASFILDDASMLFKDIQSIVSLVKANEGTTDTFIVVDVEFCRSEVMAQATNVFATEFPVIKQTLIYFENNPEHCLENVASRADGRSVEGFIKTYSKVYNPPEDANVIRVYNAEREAQELAEMEEEERLLQARMDYFDNLGEENGFTSIWSNYTDGGEPLVIDQIPYPEATKMIYRGSWGQPVETVLKHNSTWLDIWFAADMLIKASGDAHHIFIEGFGYPNKEGMVVVDKTVIELYTGS